MFYSAKYDEPVQGMIGNDQKLEKPPPKKRGRKRRIDIEMSNRYVILYNIFGYLDTNVGCF